MIFTDPLLQLTNDANLNKYRTGGKIVSKVLEELIKRCKPGEKIYDLCTFGDKMMLEEVGRVAKNINHKGISFPTCISRNNIVGQFSPGAGDPTRIEDGDLLKVELGVHIDGFPAVVAYTVVVSDGGEENIVDSRIKNLLSAVSETSREILTVMKPGRKNTEVVKIMERCAKKYGCSVPMVTTIMNAPGIFSFQVSQNVIDGFNDDSAEYIHHFILHRESPAFDFTLQEDEFEEDEVYTIDVVMSSGEGRLNQCDSEPTLYKRCYEHKEMLKLRTARNVLTQFKHGFPVNMRDSLTPRFKLGAKECQNKKLLEIYPPVQERFGELVARAKFTVIIKKKPILITGRPVDDQLTKCG